MNVILLVVDTLRARSMSCYGYPKPTCPNIDRFARQGVLFENTSAVVHNTHPAFTTLFTGMYPITHRVVRMNGNYALEHQRFRLLPQLMKLGGFKTASIDNLEGAGQAVQARWMNRGFDMHYNYILRDSGAKHEREMLCNINRTAFGMLEELKNERFFLFIHPWDTHSPYLPREEFARQFHKGDPSKRVNYGVHVKADYDETPSGRCLPHMKQPDPENILYTRAMYHACVADMDEAFGALLKKLDELGLAEDTLVVLTSDHGENLAEHTTLFNHRWAYEDCISIPLILRWPKGLPSGKRIQAFAQQTDVAPTILDLAGAPPEPVMDGLSLAPVMRGQTDQTYPYAHMHATIPDTRRAIRSQRYKFIEWLEGCPREADVAPLELYDLQEDPGETKNLIDEKPDAARQLQSELRRWVEEKMEHSKEIFGARRLDPLIEQAWQGHIPYVGIPRWFPR